MLNQDEFKKAKDMQFRLTTMLSRLLMDLSGDDNLDKIYEMSYHFQDLQYVHENLKDIHDFWFQENDYAKE